MEDDIDKIIKISNKLYSSNKEALLLILADLKNIMGGISNERVFKKMEDIIININNFISDYKKKVNILNKAIENLHKTGFKRIKEFIEYDNGTYNGETMGGERDGKGLYFFKAGDIYEGDWKKNKMEGRGIYYYYNGDIYEGEWKDGKLEGRGMFYFKSGDIWDGYYENNKRNGKGIYYFVDGDRYEGDWKEGKKHGKGVYYFANGDRKMGDYFNDIETGKHVTLTKSGDVLTDNYN